MKHRLTPSHALKIGVDSNFSSRPCTVTFADETRFILTFKDMNKKKGADLNDHALVKLIQELDERSQHILNVILPQKCFSLTTILETDKQLLMEPEQVRSELGIQKNENGEKEINTKKRKLEQHCAPLEEHPSKKQEFQVESNTILVQALIKVKLEIVEFIDYITTLKLWVHLHVPKIEDGNNFGVQVQEEVLAELGRCEDFTVQSLSLSTKYFITRAKVIAKCFKHPGIKDFEECVHQLDEKTYIELITILRDLRNNYAIVYDFVQKNKDKILCPRNSYSGAMF